MRRRWGIGATVAGLLVLLLWLLWRPATAPESASRGAGRPVRLQARAPSSSVLGSTATLAGARGTLSIQGRVVGPHGPVSGAIVFAFARASREWPSLSASQRRWPPDAVSSCDLSLEVMPLLELAAELRGKQLPLARATTDTQGNFRLEGLEPGTLALWVESAEGLALRGDVIVGSQEVEVRLGPGMTFSGVVLDDQGRPAAGALVTTLQRDAGRFVETSTNEEGQFLLGPLPWGRYDLLFSKEGLGPARLNSYAWEPGPVQVTLPTPRRIAGQVVDERGPVSGATVQVEGDVLGKPVVTDLQGRFALEVPCPRRYILTASDEGRYARQLVSLESGLDKEAVTLLLGPTSIRLSGRVTDTSDQPIEGAEVSLFGGALQWMGSARTDARGEFLFERLPPGTYTTIVQAARYEPKEMPPFLFSVSQELRFTLKARERRAGNAEEATLEVEWVDAAERPVSQEHVRVSKPGFAARSAVTGMDGRAVFQGLTPGSYVLEPQTWEAWSDYAPLRVELRGSETRKVRLQPSEEGWSLSGQVVDAEGNPIEGALVIASRVVDPGAPPEDASSGRLRRSSVRGRSGPDGGFTLTNLPEGPCTLQVTLRGYALDTRASSGLDDGEAFRWNVGVSPGNPEVRLVLRTHSWVRGRMVREDGGPITSFQINDETVSHPDGRFSLPVSYHRVSWRFSARGYSWVFREVVTREGEELELGDVVLVADRTVRGRVLEAGTSAPVAGAYVVVGRQSGSSLPDGSFTLEGVNAGRVGVLVTHPDWLPGKAQLAEGQREITVVLGPGATLQGRIESAGVPVPSGSVKLRSEQGVLQATMGFSEGRYSLRAIPAGRYLVQVVAQPGETGPVPIFPIRQVELSAGVSVTLDFTAQSEGTVVEIFVPERAVEVHLIPGSLPLMGPKDGLYSKLASGLMGKSVREGVRGFPRLPAGSYTLFAMRRGEDTTEVHREELEVPAGGNVTFTLLPQWSLFDD
ncbi:carboxypeptidase regulatory-like domain-containing protein [Archangium lansingense]|uniref:carboxypeptidase regulatory-like domain-containing protein n=1 Tax=Archangium lansingense TaxID=2995310 RepID=UPI003B828662